MSHSRVLRYHGLLFSTQNPPWMTSVFFSQQSPVICFSPVYRKNNQLWHLLATSRYYTSGSTTEIINSILYSRPLYYCIEDPYRSILIRIIQNRCNANQERSEDTRRCFSLVYFLSALDVSAEPINSHLTIMEVVSKILKYKSFSPPRPLWSDTALSLPLNWKGMFAVSVHQLALASCWIFKHRAIVTHRRERLRPWWELNALQFGKSAIYLLASLLPACREFVCPANKEMGRCQSGNVHAACSWFVACLYAIPCSGYKCRAEGVAALPR